MFVFGDGSNNKARTCMFYNNEEAGQLGIVIVFPRLLNRGQATFVYNLQLHLH